MTKQFIPSINYLRQLASIKQVEIFASKKLKHACTLRLSLPYDQYEKTTGKNPEVCKKVVKMAIKRDARTILADLCTGAALTETGLQTGKFILQSSKKGPKKVLEDYFNDKDSKTLENVSYRVDELHKFMLSFQKHDWEQVVERMAEIHGWVVSKKSKSAAGGETSEGEDGGEGDDSDGDSGGGQSSGGSHFCPFCYMKFLKWWPRMVEECRNVLS